MKIEVFRNGNIGVTEDGRYQEFVDSAQAVATFGPEIMTAIDKAALKTFIEARTERVRCLGLNGSHRCGGACENASRIDAGCQQFVQSRADRIRRIEDARIKRVISETKSVRGDEVLVGRPVRADRPAMFLVTDSTYYRDFIIASNDSLIKAVMAVR